MDNNIEEFVLNMIGGNSVPKRYTSADARADCKRIKSDMRRNGEKIPEFLTVRAIYDQMQVAIAESNAE